MGLFEPKKTNRDQLLAGRRKRADSATDLIFRVFGFGIFWFGSIQYNVLEIGSEQKSNRFCQFWFLLLLW